MEGGRRLRCDGTSGRRGGGRRQRACFGVAGKESAGFCAAAPGAFDGLSGEGGVEGGSASGTASLWNKLWVRRNMWRIPELICGALHGWWRSASRRRWETLRIDVDSSVAPCSPLKAFRKNKCRLRYRARLQSRRVRRRKVCPKPSAKSLSVECWGRDAS